MRDMIAALFVATGGSYFNLPDVDPWDESLDWGISEPRLDPAVIARMGLKRAKRLGEVGSKGGGTDSRPRIGTPEQFRDLLISIANSANKSQSATPNESPKSPKSPK